MGNKSPKPWVADRPETASSPTRIVPILSHTGNQRVLVNWLQQQEKYEIVRDDTGGLSIEAIDIVVVDEHSLHDFDTEIMERKTGADAIFPVLLVCSDTAIDTLYSRDDPETEPATSQLVDEILTTPIEKAELQNRLDTLARIRTQSLVLEDKTDQLLLLNRITRHDIRNEMNIISGWTEQLAEHTDDAGEKIRQRVLDSSRHVVDLTKAVREFTETLQTTGDPDLEAIDLKTVLDTELAKCRSKFEDAEFVLDDEIPQAHVYANDLLASVFRNILNNAVQHNDSDTPRVEIGVLESAETVAITVADNGPGIPTDQWDAVLGRTEQGLDHPAAGLGLYLVDTLVTDYGDTLQISDAELGGACIEITLSKEPATEVSIPDNDS